MIRSCALAICIAVCLSACSTPGVSKKDYATATAKIHMGMSKPDFVALFPSAQPRGAKMYPNGTVEVYEQIISDYSFAGSGDPTVRRNEWTGVESKVTWFYFYNDKLVQYGLPNDWPQDPDKIVEVRVR
jgi:hypothetical protein